MSHSAGNMCGIYQIQLRLVLLIAMFGLVVSCLITNCPRGGKRAESDAPVVDIEYTEKSINDCLTCGPEGQGVCLGKNICCGRKIGCLTELKYTKACHGFHHFKSSCLLNMERPTCGEEGECKTNYLCCSKDQCVLDLSCKSAPSFKASDFSDEFTPSFNVNSLFSALQKKFSFKKPGRNKSAYFE